MLTRIFKVAALAAAFVLALPATSDAQGRGGGGRGGGWGGGRGGGWGSPGWGGGGWNNNWGGRNFGGSGIYIGVGNAGYGNWGPGYGRGYYGGYYGSGYGYYPSSTIVTSPSYDAFYPPAANSFAAPMSASDGTASIMVRVPANAQLWWNGSPSTTGGDTRFFRTAPLGAEGTSQRFTARWAGPDGQPVQQTRDVQVMPNGTYTVDFFQQQAPAENAPAVNPQAQTPAVPPPPPVPAPRQ